MAVGGGGPAPRPSEAEVRPRAAVGASEAEVRPRAAVGASEAEVRSRAGVGASEAEVRHRASVGTSTTHSKYGTGGSTRQVRPRNILRRLKDQSLRGPSNVCLDCLGSLSILPQKEQPKVFGLVL
ncbi:hypothetical protein PVAP13_3KG403502 [Panicum virgatum]|uniref:Uncharacterized protein n=1 Tax=Panicum virgatum TaxID=38727 RepID=A0A8T0VAI9_PANVG|nr:hypothetical protein PVAP13_3KG403502 [Panicum virgatum]